MHRSACSGLLSGLALLGAVPARALLFETVSVTRSVSADANITDLANGMESVDPGQSFSSNDPSLDLLLTANASASIAGGTVTGTATSGTVTTQFTQPFGELSIQLGALGSYITFCPQAPYCAASSSIPDDIR